MKDLFIFIAVIILLPFFSIAQTVNVNGSVFLEDAVSYDDVSVIFQRQAPTSLTYTFYTDISGMFSGEIEQGVYIVSYQKEGFLSSSTESNAYYSNTTLPPITLEKEGLSGALSGTIEPGEYKVSGDINVLNNQKLIIKPGVKLRFMEDYKFEIKGQLVAEGTKQDSIVFTSYNSEEHWNGIDIRDTDIESIFSYCRLDNSKSSGLCIYYADVVITNCVFYNNSANFVGDANYGGGIYLEDGNITIEKSIFRNNHCRFRDPDHSNPYLWGSAVYTSGYGTRKISNSLFIKNGLTDDDFAVKLFGTLIEVENCVIVNNNSGGIGGNNYKISNSIILGNKGYGVQSYDNVTINNSILWDNEEGNFSTSDNWYETIVTTNANGHDCDAYLNIFMDPMFTDSADLDFTLKAQSPCINAGDNNTVTSEADFLGNIRIFNKLVDMGAYEFGASFFENISPVITSFHPDQQLDADTQCGAILADYTGTVEATDNYDMELEITQSPEPGTLLSLGSNIIHLQATDDSGNSAGINFNVQVADRIFPEITCPENQEFDADQTNTYTVEGEELNPLDTNDNCDIKSIINDFNNSETLFAAQFPAGLTQVSWTITDISGNPKSCSYDVKINDYVSIKEIAQNEVLIFPNPSDGIFKIINSKNEIITISDISGRNLFSTKINSDNQQINISGYKKGIYFIEFSNQKNQKIIIE